MRNALALTFVGDPIIVAVLLVGMVLWLGLGFALAAETGRRGGSMGWGMFWWIICWPVTLYLLRRHRADPQSA
jgi:hypothetical protein